MRHATALVVSVCLGLSPAIWAQFTFRMCDAAQNRQKITKTLILGVQGHWGRYPKKLITSACYDKQHVYAYMQCVQLFSC